MIVKFSKAAISIVATSIGAALVFSFLAPWLPIADSVAHFRLHLAVGMAVMAAVLTVGRAWRPAGIAWIAAATGLIGLAPALSVFGAAQAGPTAPTITLVQLNLSFQNATPDAVVALIRDQAADIVTLQEVHRNTQVVVTMLGDDYPYRIQCPFAGVGGVAVLSRLPKAPGLSEGCVEKQGLVWLRVMAGGKPISVASLHLHWPYPYRQGQQLDRLQTHLQKIPRPVLLAGDFNAAPWSHAVSRVAEATGTRVAGGLRFTLHQKISTWAPPMELPIDHILLPPEISSGVIQTGRDVGSDHLPVVAKLVLP